MSTDTKDYLWYTKPIHKTLNKSVTFNDLHQRQHTDLVGKQPSDQRHVSKTMDDYARDYFPTTFTVPYILQSIDVKAEDIKNNAPKAKGLKKPNITPWRTNVDKMNLMITENPATCKDANFLIIVFL